MNTDMNTRAIQATTRDPYSSRERYSARNLLGYAAIIGIAVFGVRAQAVTIEFNDFSQVSPEGISVPDCSLGGSCEFYQEDGMHFIARDDASYLFFQDEVPDGGHGYISPHGSGPLGSGVIRMIYDPDKNGVWNRFDLLGLQVRSDARAGDPPGSSRPVAYYVHAEVDHSSVNGAVYGPVGEGSWGLTGPGNTGLLFVDFARCNECANGTGGIDNIVFEPATGTVPTAGCNGTPATIVGTSGNDTIFGTALRDVIQGLGGNDTITGYYDNDRICGGGGNDTISGGFGADKLYGGPGNKDSCDGGKDDKATDTAEACETKTNIP